MTLPLFPAPAAHDPGGAVRTKLPVGMLGDAVMSECGRYRPVLTRWWGKPKDDSFMLWIGMNPSTADADVNDPTVAREIGFTKRQSFSRYVKTNVMDYRATSPKRLLEAGVEPRSAVNLETIAALAGKASRVVACWGSLHPKLRCYAADVVAALEARGVALWCLGLTSNGSPRHPLYVHGDTPFIRFEQRTEP